MVDTIYNKNTGRYIQDTPANRKRLGMSQKSSVKTSKKASRRNPSTQRGMLETLTKQQLMKILKSKKISFSSSDTKTGLISLIMINFNKSQIKMLI